MPSTASHAPRREFLGAGEEIAGSVIDQHIQRPSIPDLPDHLLDGITLAHIADITANLARSAVSQLAAGLLQHIRSAPADVNRRAELQKALRHRASQAGAASGNQNTFALEQIWLEHFASPIRFDIRHRSRANLPQADLFMKPALPTALSQEGRMEKVL